jgi:hypothetical protein
MGMDLLLENVVQGYSKRWHAPNSTKSFQVDGNDPTV